MSIENKFFSRRIKMENKVWKVAVVGGGRESAETGKVVRFLDKF